VQTNRSELRLVDYIEGNHRNVVDYGNQLKGMPLNWGTDYLPWDVSQERYQFTDPANSPEGVLRKMGRRVEIVPRADVETGIKRARLIFPRCYFDKERTVRLRECLKRYKRVIPATTDEPSNPCHDEFSHGADAFRYMALVADQLRNEDSFRKPIKYPKRAYV
jgi:phage terminase large subunit